VVSVCLVRSSTFIVGWLALVGPSHRYACLSGRTDLGCWSLASEKCLWGLCASQVKHQLGVCDVEGCGLLADS
jgi:hypothetical protein